MVDDESESICWERDDGRHRWAEGVDRCEWCGVPYAFAISGRTTSCEACDGTGWGPLAEDCRACDGTGYQLQEA